LGMLPLCEDVIAPVIDCTVDPAGERYTVGFCGGYHKRVQR
jgi:hypothetical protein